MRHPPSLMANLGLAEFTGRGLPQSAVDCSMRKGKVGETKSEVLDKSGASDRQLKRWRKEGLIPTPAMPSRGHARGREAIYPPGTGDLAGEILGWLEKVDTLLDVGYCLWCAGHDELTQYVRQSLLAGIREGGQKLHSGLAAFQEDDPDNPVARAATMRSPAGLGWLRGRIGRQRFTTPAFFGLSSLAGQLNQHDFDDEVPAALVESLQLLFSQILPPELDITVSPEETEALFLRLSKVLSVPAGIQWLEEASDDELCAVRDEAVAAFHDWAPDLADDWPPPIGVFVAAYVGRGLFPDAPTDQPQRAIVNYLLSHGEPVAQRLGAAFRDGFMTGTLPLGSDS